MLSHALLKEELVHTPLQLREVRPLRVLARDHLQPIEISVNKDASGHAEETHADSMCVVTDKSVDQILRQPRDTVECGH